MNDKKVTVPLRPYFENCPDWFINYISTTDAPKTALSELGITLIWDAYSLDDPEIIFPDENIMLMFILRWS